MEKELYSEIEDLIITWNLDGSKTAGALTREIMLLIEDHNKKEKYFQQFHPKKRNNMKLQFEDNDYYLMDDNNTIATTDKIMLKVDGSIKKLSKENCDEIFGTLSIEEIALSKASHIGGVYRNPEGFSNEQIGYLHGFIEGAELNKDKLFTVEDIMKAFEAGYETLESEKTYNEHYDILIQSLQQPTEIEVEIRCWIGNGDKESDSFKDPLVTNTGIPKLDINGCLILKKK